jgi:two-component sensor histidine kinase
MASLAVHRDFHERRRLSENSGVPESEHERALASLHRSEAWLSAQKDAFQAAVNDAPLAEALGFLVRAAIEQMNGNARCAFNIANHERTALRHVVGMPESFARHVEEFKVGLDSLACGLAVATGQPVITPDVRLEPRWARWLWRAKQFDFRGCWSFPVETSAGKIVGTFAIYSREPREPTPQNLEFVATLTHTASIIISRHREAEERKLAAEALRENEARLKAILNQLPGGVFLIDRDGRFLLRGGELSTLWGGDMMPSYDANSIRQFRAYDADGRQLALSDYPGPRALRGEIVEPGVDFIHTADDGRERWVRVSAAPFRDAAGEIVGIVAIIQDIDQTKRTEARLRQSEAGLQDAMDLVQLGRYVWDPQKNEMESDGRLRAFWGLPAGAPFTFETWRAGVHPDDLERLAAAVLSRADPQGDGQYGNEYRVIGQDGVERWIAARGRITFQNDRPVSFHGVALDVTERKRSEQANLLLIAELQHRTRNLLAVVNGIAMDTLAASRSLADFAATFGDRLTALSRVQGLLSRGDVTAVTISELVHMELQALGAEPDGRRITVEGPEVVLPKESVQILALALHELVTNARKHGALAAPEGRLAVAWHTTIDRAGRSLVIQWREQRAFGATKGASSERKGFGRTLIEEALPYQLDAKTRFEVGADRVFCSVAISLDPHKAGTGQ